MILRDRPGPFVDPDPEAGALLRRAFADYRLSIAGPLIPFDATIALAAAAFVEHACWFLVSRAEPVEELEQCLVLSGAPHGPAQHLSADLVLRFVAQIHRRARARDSTDRLTVRLAEVLRRWPLSGVLADVEEGPLTPPAFGAHPGLLLLYAERLARHEKLAWLPEGPGLEYLELVKGTLGSGSGLAPSAGKGASDD